MTISISNYLDSALGKVSRFWPFYCLIISSHLSRSCEGRWGATDDFATPFSLFSTAFWNLANTRPVHSLMLFSHLFLCRPCPLSPFTVPCKMVWTDLMNGRYDHTTAVCVSLRWPGGLRVVRLPAGCWHGLPRWYWTLSQCLHTAHGD